MVMLAPRAVQWEHARLMFPSGTRVHARPPSLRHQIRGVVVDVDRYTRAIRVDGTGLVVAVDVEDCRSAPGRS